MITDHELEATTDDVARDISQKLQVSLSRFPTLLLQTQTEKNIFSN